MYERRQKAQLLQRLQESRQFIQVVYGPRQVGQVGKTTMITQLIDQIEAPVHFAAADALGGADGIWIAQQWETARLKLRQTQASFCLLVVDEVQKIQVHNTALLSAQAPETFLQVQSTPQQWGRWVESAVGAHLMNASLTEDFKLFYWRQGNNEVDFVIEQRGKAIGLEIKSGGAGKTKGMQTFRNKFAPHKVYLVGKSGIDWPEFLELRPSELF